MSGKKISYTKSSGNVYQDMGFPDANERLAKAKLAIRIQEIIDRRGLTQKEAAKTLDIRQPKISALMNGQLKGFSLEKLIYFLNLLNQDVEITVKNRPRALGRLKIAFS